MKDSREILRSVGTRTLQAVAGLFALSWIGIVLFPLTVPGLIILLLALALLAHLYKRNLTPTRTVVALAFAGIAIFAANVLAIGGFGGQVYVFSCSTLSLSCARVHEQQAFSRSIMLVPIWKPKTWLLRLLLSERDGIYFPTARQVNGGTLLHAPLEEQALLAAPPRDKQGWARFGVDVNLAITGLSVEREPNGELVLGLASGLGLPRGIEFQSALSDSVAGQFSILSPSEPGLEEWKRAAFSNELIRALLIDDADIVLSKLAEEAARTSLMEDHVRYATLRLALNEAYYSGLPGASQRLADLRSAIERVDAYGDFHLAPHLPWNRAFVRESIDTLNDLQRLYSDTEQPRSRRLAEGVVLSVHDKPGPWRKESEWIRKKAERLVDPLSEGDRSSDAFITTVFGRSFSKVSDFYDRIEEFDPPDRDSLRAKSIARSGKAFEHFLVEWLAEAPKARPRRVALAREMVQETFSLEVSKMWTDELPKLLAAGGDSDLRTKMLLFQGIESARARLALADAKLLTLRDYATTEFQRIEFSGDSGEFEVLLDFFQAAILCRDGDDPCVDRAVDKFLGKMREKASPLIASFLTEFPPKGTASARRLATTLSRILSRVATPASAGERDQAAASLIMLVLEAEAEPMRRYLPALCNSADQYSLQLLSEPESDDRIMLHESAAVLALACKRTWGTKHRLVLARNELDPGLWVRMIERRLVELKGRR